MTIWKRGGPNAPSERALSAKQNSFGRFVEHDGRLAGPVGLLERPAPDHRDSEGFKILRGHPSEADRGPRRVGLDRPAFDVDHAFNAAARTLRWRRLYRSTRPIPRPAWPARVRAAPRRTRPRARPSGTGRAERCGQRDDTLGVEAERHVDHVPQAAQQQRGAAEQRQRQRDLRGDQRKSETRLRAQR